MKRLPTISCCTPLAGSSLSDGEAVELERLFRVLADRHRVKILNILLRAGGQAVCVCEFTDQLGLAQPTVSYHLKQLREAGLLDREKRGTFAYFRLRRGCDGSGCRRWSSQPRWPGPADGRRTTPALVAEAIGTFALVFAGCGAIMVDANTGALGHVGVAISFGLVIMVMIYAVGHISGAHFNPAVTLRVRALAPLPVAARRRLLGGAAGRRAGGRAGPARLAGRRRPRRRHPARPAPTARRFCGRRC